ncbi:autotransporter outer membrane beta-barrel domain-containing protein [Pseudomonas sp. TTU2014-080ASC]|uniref:autotransporter outer membrane beta-barrel domain-containing protein n=1 Tax=Pseudomonas sp. TTU2014-080ASC TaxID=1729724 RepID=UPI00071887C9|nr:autotransporter outer membrane beta-barrel domain-containing protein [Pseudomonas sp. TTU2014-080ASC]KRW59838.1 hypothetical protein AO726_13680 [Pseudomonas sp. TTU2014-080ASC]
MNKVYRLVWRAASQSWVVASELARGKTKVTKAGRHGDSPRHSSNLLPSKLALSIASGLLFITAMPAQAILMDWTPTTADTDLMNPANWTPEEIPGGVNDLQINRSPAAVLKDTWASAKSIQIGNKADTSGTLELKKSGEWGSVGISAEFFTIGSGGGIGTLTAYNTVEGNTSMYFTNDFHLGAGVGSVGTINALGSGKSLTDWNFHSCMCITGQSYNGSTDSVFALGANGGQGIINVNGGALATQQGVITAVGMGSGSFGIINVLAGGKYVSEVFNYATGVHSFVIGAGGNGTLNLFPTTTTNRNMATAMAGLQIGSGAGGLGTVNILGGGKLVSLSGSPDVWNDPPELHAQVGVNGGTGKVNIDGTGSIWMVGGLGTYYEDDTTTVGSLYLGHSGTGQVTLSNGGELFIGVLDMVVVRNPNNWSIIDPTQSGRFPDYSQPGPLYMAYQPGSIGIINFGSDPNLTIGGAQVGKLVAEKIVLGQGSAFINFNHTQNLRYSDLLPTLDSSMQGNGTLTLASYAGTTHLDIAQPDFKGFTDIYGGTFWVDDPQALGSSVIRGRYHSGVPEGGTLGYNNGLNLRNSMELYANAKLSLRVDGSNSATHSGTISGNGNLLKTGTGTLNLTAANSYTGVTHIKQGALALTGNSSIANSAGVIANGTLDISDHTGDTSIKTLSGNSQVLLGSNTLNITAGNSNGAGSGLFSGVISGAGGLTVTGGSQFLSGQNTWQGPTTVRNASTLGAAATNTFSPASSYRVDSGGLLLLNAFNQRIDSLSNAGSVVLNIPEAVSSRRRTSFRPTTLTVTGANTYHGDGGTLVMRTQLGDDSSPTDKLVVNGNTSGTTQLLIRNAGGQGALTNDGIRVVQVDGESAGKFVLAAPVEAGAFEYHLLQGQHDVPGNGNWYLTSSGELPGPCPGGLPGPCDGKDDNEPNYRSEVANVVAGQTANMEQGMRMLASLHQRIGGDYDLKDENLLGWSRLYYLDDRSEGERFNYNQRFTGLQFGHDLWVQHDANGTSQRAGVSIDYTHAEADFEDQARTRKGLGNKDTGSMSTNTFSAGGYYTLSTADGAYVDTVAMVSRVRNGFTDIYDDKGTQKGWRVGISAEVGKPIATFADTWNVEPQLQLSYQHTRYETFDDEVSVMEGYSVNTVRGRAGLRLYNDLSKTEKPSQAYVIANVLHDFIKPTEIEFSGTKVRDKYDSTSGELGVGGRIALSKTATLFGDARYRHSFGGDTQSTALNIGIQIDF